MPEFGENIRQSITGWPVRLLYVENTFGSPATGFSVAVPDGQTWVVLGTDHWAAVPAPANVQGFFFGPGGIVLWAGKNPVQVYFPDPLDELRETGGSVSWRGAVPFYPGETFGLETESSGGSGTFSSASAFGIVLPYVVEP